MTAFKIYNLKQVNTYYCILYAVYISFGLEENLLTISTVESNLLTCTFTRGFSYMTLQKKNQACDETLFGYHFITKNESVTNLKSQTMK